MHIGEKIKQIRILKNLKQSAVAAEVGLSVTAYGNIERGKTFKLSVTRLLQIASVLQVPPDEILYSSSSKNALLKRIEELKQMLDYKEQELKHFRSVTSKSTVTNVL
jgi:transcriptional regulator with XRE-family HTH domain